MPLCFSLILSILSLIMGFFKYLYFYLSIFFKFKILLSFYLIISDMYREKNQNILCNFNLLFLILIKFIINNYDI